MPSPCLWFLPERPTGTLAFARWPQLPVTQSQIYHPLPCTSRYRDGNGTLILLVHFFTSFFLASQIFHQLCVQFPALISSRFKLDQFLFFWLASSCYLKYLYAIQHGYQLWAPDCNIQQRGSRAFTFDIRHPLLTSWLWLSGWPGEVLFIEHPILISLKALESETKQHWVLACLLLLTHPISHTSRIWSLLGINKWIKNIQGLKLLHFNRVLQH